jgi:hypothetical protein
LAASTINPRLAAVRGWPTKPPTPGCRALNVIDHLKSSGGQRHTPAVGDGVLGLPAQARVAHRIAATICPTVDQTVCCRDLRGRRESWAKSVGPVTLMGGARIRKRTLGRSRRRDDLATNRRARPSFHWHGTAIRIWAVRPTESLSG